LDATLRLVYRRTKVEVTEEKEFYLLLPKTSERGYEKAIISKTKNESGIVASLKVGEWSGILSETFETAEGNKQAVFRIKLVQLAPDASELRLYFTPLCQLDGWSFPESVAGEIKTKEGLPLPHISERAFRLGWIDLRTYTEIIEMQNTWFKEAGEYLLKNYPWTLFFMQAHCPDYFYHLFMNRLDPTACPDEKERALHEEAECCFYKSLDDMIGGLVETAGPETLVVITSDHGAVPFYSKFNPGKLLEEAGLTVYRINEATQKREVDWSRTKAIWQRSIYVYVNVKGRDPQGIVEPGEGYEKVRDQVIDILSNYVDPKTGKKPMVLVLRREDARVLGLYGDRIGDVVCAWGPGAAAAVGEVHGGQLPTVETGAGSMKGLLIMYGSGIKKGVTLQRTVWLTDITPTICYLLEIPIPHQAEGTIIYQALEDPDIKMKELQTLRRDYQRALAALHGDKALTHDYSTH